MITWVKDIYGINHLFKSHVSFWHSNKWSFYCCLSNIFIIIFFLQKISVKFFFSLITLIYWSAFTPSQDSERSCISVFGEDFCLSLWFFLFDFGNLPTVWFFLHFISWYSPDQSFFRFKCAIHLLFSSLSTLNQLDNIFAIIPERWFPLHTTTFRHNPQVSPYYHFITA